MSELQKYRIHSHNKVKGIGQYYEIMYKDLQKIRILEIKNLIKILRDFYVIINGERIKVKDFLDSYIKVYGDKEEYCISFKKFF